MRLNTVASSAGVLFLTLCVGVVIGVGAAVAAQPHMESALSSLRAARTELIAATPDKGSHRGKAIRLVDQAIDETQAGMEYARTH